MLHFSGWDVETKKWGSCLVHGARASLQELKKLGLTDVAVLKAKARTAHEELVAKLKEETRKRHRQCLDEAQAGNKPQEPNQSSPRGFPQEPISTALSPPWQFMLMLDALHARARAVLELRKERHPSKFCIASKPPDLLSIIACRASSLAGHGIARNKLIKVICAAMPFMTRILSTSMAEATIVAALPIL